MGDEESLREALAAVEVGVWSWNMVDDRIVWSDEMRRLFSHSKGTPVTYAAYLALVPQDERPRLQAVIEDAIDSAAKTQASTTYFVEHRLLLEDGATRWIEGRGRVSVDAAGRPTRISGTAVDVTVSKAALEQVRKSEELYRMFTELASDYVYVVDFLKPSLYPEIVAGSFERTTGLTPAGVEALGGWMKVIHPDDLAGLATMEAGLPQGKPSINEYRIIDGVGQIRWLRDYVRPVLDPSSGKVVKLMGGVQDVTERKRLEEQLVRAQKLEAIARLSGGIAHDFNNLLSVVMGSVAVLERETRTVAGRDSCEAIMAAATRGAELTKSLLAFARRDVGSPQLVNLADVVQAALPMLCRAVGAQISVSLTGVEVAAPAFIDSGQVQLVLLNLAVNARDAMPAGGSLRITLAPATYGREDGLPIELAPGNWIRLVVADDGLGIVPEVMARIFEPFFTTKQQGKGTGLGLAACHGIVQAAHGAIEVASVVGKGSTFTIYLPLSKEKAAARVGARSRHSPGGTERILLVEDEKTLQHVLSRSLRDLGYTVQCADSAEAALIALATQPFDLLISDVVLPGMYGTDLVRQASERWPSLLALLMSGYSGPSKLPAGVPLLHKPFTIDRLASQVRAVLDEVRPPMRES